MASISFASFLMKSTTAEGTFTKVMPVKTTPAMLDQKEGVESTTLEDPARTFVEGLRNTPSGYQFTANYTLENARAAEALKNTEQYYAVWLGGTENNDGTVTPTGDLGKFICKGTLSWSLNEQAVNAIREMTLTIMPSIGFYASLPTA